MVHFDGFGGLMVIGVTLSLVSGCAALSAKPEGSEKSEKSEKEELAELRISLTSLTARLEGMETKLSSMNDKVDSTRVSVDNLLNIKKPQTTSVLKDPALLDAQAIEPSSHRSDPESGFLNDSAIQAYRQALLLFNAKKYSEAILAFSAFLEQEADHALAGSAQYYVGESYFQQKEYKLAEQEFGRVLTSYDRSRHVPDTLRRLAEISDLLKQSDSTVKYRHLLTSLFPQSPAAASGAVAAPLAETAASEPPPAESASSLDAPPPTAPVSEEKHE